jgi:O-antigen ligase
VVGLLAYLLVLIAPIAGALQSPRDSQFRSRLYGTLIVVVGFVCCGAINLMFGFELMTTLYVCFAAILLGYCRDRGAVGVPSSLPAVQQAAVSG